MEETVIVVKKRLRSKKFRRKPTCKSRFRSARRGLFKKAAELSVLCSADVAVLVQSPAGKVFATGGHASVDSIIDRYVAALQGKHQEEEEEKKYLDIMKEIEIEKVKGKLLMQHKDDNSKGFWWDQPVDNLELDELVEHMDAMEILRQNVLTRAEAMAANNNVVDNNAIPAVVANDNPGDNNAANNNVATNNNADFSSSVLIPNVSLDNFGGRPVILCESDNEDKVDGTDDPFMLENLNFETNSHQLLISGNPKLEADDELFMFDNPNSLIDDNQLSMLAIPKLEIDVDEPLMLENPKSPITIDQLLML
nr:agamous-like MADS-box protein AGL23 [Coffea arabica]